MTKTGPEIRHEAKERMKKYRAEMTAKGYISTTVFLSQGHRAELKRLGDEHRLTRAEAAEHIFKAYLESENKNITQTHNTNTNQQAETRATIEALESRIKALENQAENSPAIKAIADQVVQDVEQDAARLQADLDKPKKTVTEKPLDLFTNEQTAPDLEKLFEGLDPDNITIEQRDMLVLRLHEQYPGKKHAQDRIKILNDKKIYYNGKPWTTKDFSDQANHARTRTKNRAKKN